MKLGQLGFTHSKIVNGLSIFLLALALTFWVFKAFAQGPDVSHLVITDVTPVSFSVIWTASEPSSCDLKVFRDSQGTQVASEAIIIPMPVNSGDTSIAQQAENNGVMKVRVTGLSSNTAYYFQTLTISKSSSEITAFPESPPYSTIKTAGRNTCAMQLGQDLLPFSNDLIKVECFLGDGSTPAEGTLLLAYAFGASFPVSSFVGDDTPLPYACVDLGNLFRDYERENIYLPGNESLLFVQYMGIQGYKVLHYGVPCNDLLSQFKTPIEKAPCSADFGGDGIVDTDDLRAFANFFGFTNGIQPDFQPFWGDLDGDGDTDGFDLSIIANESEQSDCFRCP